MITDDLVLEVRTETGNMVYDWDIDDDCLVPEIEWVAIGSVPLTPWEAMVYGTVGIDTQVDCTLFLNY